MSTNFLVPAHTSVRIIREAPYQVSFGLCICGTFSIKDIGNYDFNWCKYESFDSIIYITTDDSFTVLCSFYVAGDLTKLPALEQFLARAFLNAWYGRCGYVTAENPNGEIPFSPPAFLRNQPIFSSTSLASQPWLN